MFGPSYSSQSSEDLLLSMPFNKFEIGRYLDANSTYNRNYGPKTAFTATTSEDISFQMVDSKARTTYSNSSRPRPRAQTKQKWQKSPIELSARNTTQRSSKVASTRDPLMVSIELQPEWKPTMSLSLKFINRYQASSLKVSSETVKEASDVPQFNNDYNVVYFNKIHPIERSSVSPTPIANDPFMKQSDADIIISSDVLARLMAINFSSYGFDLSLVKRGSQYIFDWSDEQGTLEWVNENNELVPNLPYNEAKAVAIESSELSQSFKKKASDATQHYVYTEYTLNTGSKSVRMLVRGTVDASDITIKRTYDSEGIVHREETSAYECLHSLLENKFELKTLEWAKKLSNKQNILSEVLKTDSFKIATWLLSGKLSGAENIRTAFMQRTNPATAANGHKMLGTRKDNIDVLLSSMNINMQKGWDCFYAIFNRISSSLENVDSGNYVFVRMKTKENEIAVYPQSLLQN